VGLRAMERYLSTAALVTAAAVGHTVLAQAPRQVDFGRDIQPIFKTHCIGCHGPSLQSNGLRLDRRSDAMRGGTIAVIGPGNAAASRVYLRLIGNEYGLQMPPTGALSAEEIEIIKAWIDQGAIWPDQLSGETPASPPDPIATQIIEALRSDNREALEKLIRDQPDAANRRGRGGSTPLMHAALYEDVAAVQRLLETGADPNIRNDAGATALMWAVDDQQITKMLLEHKADANARSNDSRTPLLIAAGRNGSNAVVRLLLDHGADPLVKAPGPGLGDVTPLSEAASVGDGDTFRTLVERGANVRGAGPAALHFALQSNCEVCRDLLLQAADRAFLTAAMLLTAPPRGDARSINVLLEHGADPTAADRTGHTILMLAADSDQVPADVIRALLARGADINATSPKGERALDFANQRGKTAIVNLLIDAGAKAGQVSPPPQGRPHPASSVRAAVERSIPLLERTDQTFLQKSGCVSCHHESLTSMTIARARANHLPVSEAQTDRRLRTIANYLDSWRERVLQGDGIPGLANTISYILVGMAADQYPPDETTDALTRYLKGRQLADGRWRMRDHRPPIISSDFQVTAASIRALQVYAPKRQRPQYENAVRRAVAWLEHTQPVTTEDRTFQVLGLNWAHGSRQTMRDAAHALLAEQRTDGGWAQLPTLASDAYATGEALVALNECGALRPTDGAYTRGIGFLLKTQFEDGSWYVKSRAIPIMPFFESDFPFGADQWISAAATNWATMALAAAAR
jgi:ankyrin repeat protein